MAALVSGWFVAVYVRISADDDLLGDGVAEQIRWGLAYAARHWPGVPVVVYEDNDRSARKRRSLRPDFNRLVVDIAAGAGIGVPPLALTGDGSFTATSPPPGRLAHLVTRDQYRLTRDAAHWFDLADDLFEPVGIAEIHTIEGVKSVDDLGAEIGAVLGRRQLKENRRNQRIKLDALARDGRPKGGRVYGYRNSTDDQGRKTLEVVTAEADVIRGVAEQVLAGWSLENIARALTADKTATPRPLRWEGQGAERRRVRTSGVWRPNQVKRIVTNPTVAGLRAHQGEIVGGATWESILDEATWRQVGAVLGKRTRVKGAGGREWDVRRAARPARRHLLTGGIAICGLCCKPLVGGQRAMRPGSQQAVAYYQCHPRKGGCSKVGILGEKLEAEVTSRLLAKLMTPTFQRAYTADDYAARRKELSRELADLQAQKSALARRWGDGQLDDDEWDAARDGLENRRQRLSAELAAVPAPSATVDPAQVAASWRELNFDERRKMMALYISDRGGHVVIGPAKVKGGRFDPSRITIEGPGWDNTPRADDHAA